MLFSATPEDEHLEIETFIKWNYIADSHFNVNELERIWFLYSGPFVYQNSYIFENLFLITQKWVSVKNF